jgi:hypothetical protein
MNADDRAVAISPKRAPPYHALASTAGMKAVAKMLCVACSGVTDVIREQARTAVTASSADEANDRLCGWTIDFEPETPVIIVMRVSNTAFFTAHIVSRYVVATMQMFLLTGRALKVKVAGI